ncbi:dolichyl-phosphate-mannose--protein O-mannosyl transferase [Spinactinospora alkalitolerans]|uniref:Polyprenol-phosphate-mannose--protein mannosyltransferase n=1 Tax=Spinactinospora alkalitolerans TaxID=687207 RepID=A0A852TMJ2_9ACTN|nr:phospholipid carrier-dependent glycosyltransferase [Spinactinospora alkalitolerans]NYE45516.1 dolichyl-phosphate-mannose--protein O-mannosyl transferase [Spinactinospora alkalitolerans]
MTTTALPADTGPAPAAGPSIRSRLVPPMPRPAWAGWLGALLVAAFAGALRFIGLGSPPQIYFDETYYAKDAFALRTFGVEHETVDNADALLAQGIRDVWTGGGDFIVHPPFGKWMIAAGDYLWGLMPFGVAMSPTGWRVGAAVFGALSVLLLVRVALRMTRSILLGCSAGLIMALDGLHFTMSRIAMVDVFLTLWVLAGFACLVIDRDRTRARLADLAESGRAASAGWLGVRWWRLAAGVCLGLACGTKWSALFFVAAFGLLTVAWDYGARRTAGQHRVGRRWFFIDAVPAFFATVGVAAVTYLATWSGWLFGSLGWGRQWGEEHTTGAWAALPDPVLAVVNPLRSLWYYHTEMLSFHNGLSSPHDYASHPWEWLIMRTPVAFYYNGDETTCGASACSSAILSIGSPVVWWLSVLACLVMIGWWVTYRDWRAGAVLLGVAAGWLPWFAYPERTMFVFYALPMLPFLVLAIVLALGLVMGRDSGDPRYSQRARIVGGVVYGVVMLLVIANFVYLYPVLSAEVIPYDQWADRMWFGTWIYGNATPE